MTDRRNALTPEALAMMDAIARSGSFAAAARELGKVPSALTYNVRQLEDALDVLLFDRRSRQAQLTAAGEELLLEGRRLLSEMDAVANRVRRVATGWETQLEIGVDDVISRRRCSSCSKRSAALRPDDAPDSRGGTGHAAAAAHRGAGRHLGGAGHGPGRPRDRRRRGIRQSRAASRSGRWASCASCSPSRRTTRWRMPRSRSPMRNSCSTAPSRSPIRRSA